MADGNTAFGIMEFYRDPQSMSDFALFQENPTSEKVPSESRIGRRESSSSDTIHKERERREKMSEKYSVLHSMVPSLFSISKPNREIILQDTVRYIKYLEDEIMRLEDIKKMQLQQQKAGKHVLSKINNPKSSVGVTVSSGATFFALQLPSRPGIVTKIVKVFDKHHVEVLEATVTVDKHQLLTFTATVMSERDGDYTIQKIKKEILAL